MSERYYITGVQIGIIKVLVENNERAEAVKLLDEIEDKQFVGKITQEGEKVAIIG